MKFWNVIGTVTRYILAAVSCISLAQFLLLLNVGTENAGRLAGQSLGRGVIAGLVAAVWFYRVRKVRPPAPANVQTQVQVAPPLKSQALPAAPSSDPIPVTAPTSASTTGHSSSSFWEKNIIGLMAGVAIVAILATLAMTTRGFPHLSTLMSGSSQPRFVHVQGAPYWKMVDNETGQECNTQTVTYDSVQSIKQDMHFAMTKEEAEELRKCNTESPDFPKCFASLNLPSSEKEEEIITETLADSKRKSDPPNMFDDLFDQRKVYPQYKEFYDRYDAIMRNPDKPPVYHYNGMPYCKEL